MREFNYIDLEEGEEIVFGPRTLTKSSGDTMLSSRTEGITNQRVIIEDIKTPEKTRTIPNEDIRRVVVKFKKQKGQSSPDVPTGSLPEDVAARINTLSGGSFKITQVVTAAGAKEKLGLAAKDAGKLQELFPNAEIVEKKGSKLWLILALVVLAGGFVLCGLPILLIIFGEITGGG